MAEGICWIINELLGHHKDTVMAASAVGEATAPATERINYVSYVHSLTVKQLQQLTGKTNSRFNKESLRYIALSM